MFKSLNNLYLRDQPQLCPDHNTPVSLFVFSEIALYALDVYYNQTYLTQSSKLETIHHREQMFLKVTNNLNLELTGKEIFNSRETLSLSQVPGPRSQVPRSTQYCSIMENCFIHLQTSHQSNYKTARYEK